jgi:hypothetical protein
MPLSTKKPREVFVTVGDNPRWWGLEPFQNISGDTATVPVGRRVTRRIAVNIAKLPELLSR